MALALSGTSTVTQAGTGALAASMALSGLGGVTQSGSGSLSASMALSGTSTVSQSGTGALSMSMALSGSGTVSGNATLIQKGDSGASTLGSGVAATVLPANSTVGNTVLLHIVSLGSGLSTNNIASVSSSIGTFVRLNSGTGASGDAETEVWYCLSATGAARTVTCTLTYTGAGAAYLVAAFEWNPAASAATTGGTGNGNSTTPSLTVSPSQSGNVVSVQCSTYNAQTASPTSPWTDYNGSTQWSHANGNDVAWQVASSSSNVTASWTMNNSAPNYWLVGGAVLTY